MRMLTETNLQTLTTHFAWRPGGNATPAATAASNASAHADGGSSSGSARGKKPTSQLVASCRPLPRYIGRMTAVAVSPGVSEEKSAAGAMRAAVPCG